jgi:hypothetical protein
LIDVKKIADRRSGTRIEIDGMTLLTGTVGGASLSTALIFFPWGVILAAMTLKDAVVGSSYIKHAILRYPAIGKHACVLAGIRNPQ